jgi:hypothetical protein
MKGKYFKRKIHPAKFQNHRLVSKEIIVTGDVEDV